MALRIGFDMDGVLADFESMYREIAERLFGETESVPTPESGSDSPIECDVHTSQTEPVGGRNYSVPTGRRSQDMVWAEICRTADFWTTLKPINADVMQRLWGLVRERGWEIFFITQRPETTGQSVQLQTQHWLAANGFPLPTVIVLQGSRGPLAQALDLDFLVDDDRKNCLDVLTDSRARPVMVVQDAQVRQSLRAGAEQLGITLVEDAAEALHLLESVEFELAGRDQTLSVNQLLATTATRQS